MVAHDDPAAEQEVLEMRSAVLGWVLHYVVTEDCGDSYGDFAKATLQLAAKEAPAVARRQLAAILLDVLGRLGESEDDVEPDVLVKLASRVLESLVLVCHQDDSLGALLPSEELLALADAHSCTYHLWLREAHPEYGFDQFKRKARAYFGDEAVPTCSAWKDHMRQLALATEDRQRSLKQRYTIQGFKDELLRYVSKFEVRKEPILKEMWAFAKQNGQDVSSLGPAVQTQQDSRPTQPATKGKPSMPSNVPSYGAPSYPQPSPISPGLPSPQPERSPALTPQHLKGTQVAALRHASKALAEHAQRLDPLENARRMGLATSAAGYALPQAGAQAKTWGTQHRSSVDEIEDSQQVSAVPETPPVTNAAGVRPQNASKVMERTGNVITIDGESPEPEPDFPTSSRRKRVRWTSQVCGVHGGHPSIHL